MRGREEPGERERKRGKLSHRKYNNRVGKRVEFSYAIKVKLLSAQNRLLYPEDVLCKPHGNHK